MSSVKTIALIAHDHKKDEMLAWAAGHAEILKNYSLCGTGTTARLVSEATGLNVRRYLSGPLGWWCFSGTRWKRSPMTPTSKRFCE